MAKIAKTAIKDNIIGEFHLWLNDSNSG